MHRRRLICGFLAAALALPGLGCGSGLVHVEGLVKLDGVPVDGAVVVFVREDEGGRPATSKTDAAGVFHLTTLNTGDGALPGLYKVTITPPQAYPTVKHHEGMTFGEAMEQYAKGRHELRSKPPLPGSGIPSIYADPARTPLRQVVPAEGEVVFDLQSDGSKPAPRIRPRKDSERPFEPIGGK
jgi:hypothetical protein